MVLAVLVEENLALDVVGFRLHALNVLNNAAAFLVFVLEVCHVLNGADLAALGAESRLEDKARLQDKVSDRPQGDRRFKGTVPTCFGSAGERDAVNSGFGRVVLVLKQWDT